MSLPEEAAGSNEQNITLHDADAGELKRKFWFAKGQNFSTFGKVILDLSYILSRITVLHAK